MVVAVVPVRVVQVTVDQVVHVISMGHGLVSAEGAVNMGRVVVFAGVLRRALRRVLRAHLDAVLVHVTVVGGVHVTVMEIVHMVAVFDAGVAAVGSVGVIVVLVLVAVHFGSSSAACSNTPWRSSTMWWSARE